MGVQLGDLVPKEKISIDSLNGRRIAIDAYNSLYQFLSIIRQPDGTPLMDSKGRITSHLSGLFYRTTKFVEAGVKPVYVFDGKPPESKLATILGRISIRKAAKEKWEKAKEAGEVEEARKWAQASTRLTKEMVDNSKELLDAMGIPWVQAPGEGEAQAAFIAEQGDVWGSASQDYDSLLFGSPVLLRNLAVTGRRKLPGKNIYVTVEPETIVLEKTLSGLGISREQLVDIAILVGTDYNDGVHGIGPKKALAFVKEGKSLDEVYEGDFESIRKIFLKPDVTKKYKIEWKQPDSGRLENFLVKEHAFSPDRIKNSIDTLEAQASQKATQSRLDLWG